MATMLFQGHGSYRFTLDDDTVIYVDPYFGKEYELEADLILVTHDHFDHDAVDKMPHASGCTVIRAKGLHPTSDEYLSTESHGVKIQAVQAYNDHHPSDECVGYVLDLDGKSFYAAGDTSMTEDMKSGKLAAMELDYATFFSSRSRICPSWAKCQDCGCEKRALCERGAPMAPLFRAKVSNDGTG